MINDIKYLKEIEKDINYFINNNNKKLKIIENDIINIHNNFNNYKKIIEFRFIFLYIINIVIIIYLLFNRNNK